MGARDRTDLFESRSDGAFPRNVVGNLSGSDGFFFFFGFPLEGAGLAGVCSLVGRSVDVSFGETVINHRKPAL